MGYVGTKYSTRYSEAKSNGLLTIAEINKAALKEHDINLPINFVKYLLQEKNYGGREWHHTGKYYSKTRVYNLEILKDNLNKTTAEKLAIYKEEFKNFKGTQSTNTEEQYKIVLLNYLTWSGTRKHPKPYNNEEIAIVKGNWAYLKYGKKNINSNYVDILATYTEATLPEEYKYIVQDIKNKLK